VPALRRQGVLECIASGSGMLKPSIGSSSSPCRPLGVMCMRSAAPSDVRWPAAISPLLLLLQSRPVLGRAVRLQGWVSPETRVSGNAMDSIGWPVTAGSDQERG